MATSPKQTPLGPWPNGMHNANDLPEDKYGRKIAVNKALNVDFSRTGDPRTRKGYSKLLDTTASHSLYSNGTITLFVNDSILYRLYPDSVTLAPIATVEASLSYVDIQGVIYFADGNSIRRVNSDNEYFPAWVSNPSGAPTLTTDTAGAMPPGKYQIAITNIASSGEESGTTLPQVVDVTGGGIVISDIPQAADAAYVRVYASVANGSEFYAQHDVPMGTVTTTLSAHRLGKPLETLFADAFTYGDVLAHYKGRMYVATANMLMYSESLRPGLTRVLDNYFPPFDGDIKLVMPTTTGIYVVADRTFFLFGDTPEKMSVREVYNHSGVPNTGAFVSSSVLSMEGDSPLPVWFSDTGMVIGTSQGKVVPMMENKVAIDEYRKGATLYKEENGVKSIITALQDSGEQSRLATSDSVSFEVRRNGVTIPA